jgi:putative tricarboxylic transport membrane protein
VTAIGIGVVLLALALGAGAYMIPSEAGYAGIGPDFLPWLVSGALLVCGICLVVQAQMGGPQDADIAQSTQTDAEKPNWAGFAWMSAALLLNAALITTIGFILSCTLCFVIAARGLRNAQVKNPGQSPSSGLRSWVTDGIVGLLIAAPVYWMFTKFLAINLPGLTHTGWI